MRNYFNNKDDVSKFEYYLEVYKDYYDSDPTEEVLKKYRYHTEAIQQYFVEITDFIFTNNLLGLPLDQIQTLYILEKGQE
jgi:hypothetical protein